MASEDLFKLPKMPGAIPESSPLAPLTSNVTMQRGGTSDVQVTPLSVTDDMDRLSIASKETVIKDERGAPSNAPPPAFVYDNPLHNPRFFPRVRPVRAPIRHSPLRAPVRQSPLRRRTPPPEPKPATKKTTTQGDKETKRMFQAVLQRLTATETAIEAKIENTVNARIAAFEEGLALQNPRNQTPRPVTRGLSYQLPTARNLSQERSVESPLHLGTRDDIPGVYPPEPLRPFHTPGAFIDPTPVPAASQRSIIRIDNPPAFTGDGTGPKLRDWLHLVIDRMATQAFAFPTEETKFIWVKSLIRAPALSVIRPYLSLENPTRFTTCSEIFHFFQDIYTNPDEAAEARDRLETFQQGTRTFFDFCNEFVQLATQAGLARSEWKIQLGRRLNSEMRRFMTRESTDPDVTFAEFRASGVKFDQHLREIERAERRQLRLAARPRYPAARDPVPGSRTPQPVSTTASRPMQNPRPARATTPAAPAATTSRSTLTCYNCGRPGHISPNCPSPRRTAVAYMEGENEGDLEETDGFVDPQDTAEDDFEDSGKAEP